MFIHIHSGLLHYRIGICMYRLIAYNNHIIMMVASVAIDYYCYCCGGNEKWTSLPMIRAYCQSQQNSIAILFICF